MRNEQNKTRQDKWPIRESGVLGKEEEVMLQQGRNTRGDKMKQGKASVLGRKCGGL
jgi:hypothetical protein